MTVNSLQCHRHKAWRFGGRFMNFIKEVKRWFLGFFFGCKVVEVWQVRGWETPALHGKVQVDGSMDTHQARKKSHLCLLNNTCAAKPKHSRGAGSSHVSLRPALASPSSWTTPSKVISYLSNSHLSPIEMVFGVHKGHSAPLNPLG